MLSEGKVTPTLVLGLGNILLADEGIGVRVIERLQEQYEFPPYVQVMDGGTLGLDLLPYVEQVDRLLVVDALNAGAEPGTIVRLEGEEIPAFFAPKISSHQMGLVDLLAAARLAGCQPRDLVLWGIQPQTLGVGLELSPVVNDQVEKLIGHVLAELSRWGIYPTRRVPQEEPK